MCPQPWNTHIPANQQTTFENGFYISTIVCWSWLVLHKDNSTPKLSALTISSCRRKREKSLVGEVQNDDYAQRSQSVNQNNNPRLLHWWGVLSKGTNPECTETFRTRGACECVQNNPKKIFIQGRRIQEKVLLGFKDNVQRRGYLSFWLKHHDQTVDFSCRTL